MKSILVFITAILSVIYLVNPTAGFVEFLPDNLPFIGNIDEAAVMAVLLACARYFGFDLSSFFGKKGGKQDGEKNVVDVD